MERWKLFVTFDAFLCLGVVVIAPFAMAGQQNTGSIDGIVIDVQGKTVAGAWVTILCGNRPLGGRIPGAFSDERGQFQVDSLELDQCRVYACKEDDYVPCPPSNVTRLLQVTLTAKDPSVTVKVKLGGKGTVITGMVRDAISGKLLAANFKLWQLKFPDQGMSMASPPAFRIFISPSTNYSLEVSVPGYRDWSYSAQHSPSKPLRLAPGAHLNLDVQLVPVASTGLAQTTPRAGVSDPRLPDLGAQVPASVTKARIGTQECQTDLAHYDPCARITVGGIRFTVAWDKQTDLITYLLTNDSHFITDSELSVGGMCRLSDPSDATQYTDWIITPQWRDTAIGTSGQAKWYAMLKKTDADHATITGFVQSRYLK